MKHQVVKSHIKLPNASISTIDIIAGMKFPNDLMLFDVLLILDFQLHLLLVAKLSKENNYVVLFHPKFCLIQEYLKKKA